MRDLEQFTITVDVDGLNEALTIVLDQATLYQRSAYDASYLDLAQRRRLTVCDKGEPLRKAAEELGLTLFQP
ncbi:MAG: hypothetical protein M3Y07_12110 [Acidobacteriota bacterium]|nr:hypothetical protein [Acidobacteriota bacterium]